MAQLIFPANPTDGQTYAGGNGITYVYKSSPGVWTAPSEGATSNYLGLTWTGYSLPESGLWSNIPSLSGAGWVGYPNWYADVSDTAICYFSVTGKIYRSTDAENWTLVYTAPSTPNGFEDCRLVSAGDGFWVLAANSGNVFSTDDGVTWQAFSLSGSYISADQQNDPGAVYTATASTNYQILRRGKNDPAWTTFDTGVAVGSTNSLVGFCVSSSDLGIVFNFSSRSSGGSGTDVRQSFSPTGGWATSSVFHGSSGSALNMVPLSQGGVGIASLDDTNTLGRFNVLYLVTTNIGGPYSNATYNDEAWGYTVGSSPTAAIFRDAGMTAGARFGPVPADPTVPYVNQLPPNTTNGPIRPWKNNWAYFGSGAILLQS